MSCGTCQVCESDSIQPFGVEIHTADGIFIKQMVIPKAGTLVPQHSHTYDHTTMLAKGAVHVGVPDAEIPNMRHWKLYQAPAGIFIPAGVKHMFRSLDDGCILYCIHKERDGGAAVLDPHELVVF
jgi:hypothetical protein